MKEKLLAVLLLLTTFTLRAQNKYTLSGYIRDSLSGETLIGASITIGGQGKGINSNQYGFYSITLPEGDYPVIVSFVGYHLQQVKITLSANTILNFSLLQRSVLEEVVVSSKRKDGNVENAQMGKIDLSMNQIKSIPVIFGEIDILKTMQLLPSLPRASAG